MKYLSVSFVLGIIFLLLAACSPGPEEIEITEASQVAEEALEPQNLDEKTAFSSNCEIFQAALLPYADLVSVNCDDENVYVSAESGQPDHEMMAGITAWILRFPLPFPYEGNTRWEFPLDPIWMEEHEATHSRGPLAMAVNGVPIYHFDKRPNVALDESYVYDSKFDTVQQGELDHCGGHAGQGEDYHYHLAPVCLLDDHDLDLPIGFTLGGAQIYYGAGANDYYGYGAYNDINNLPNQALDECNAIQQEDGSYIYYTTRDAPYVVGCHHEAVDWTGQIEARQMRELGEFGRNAVEILSFENVDEVRTLLFMTSAGEINAIVVTPSGSGEGCWDFEFRTDINQAVYAETHCRVN